MKLLLSRIRAIVTLPCIILLAMPLASVAALGDDQPNVIFILADDLGAGDLAVTGHPYTKTPNLDKLAGSGIRFERAYMAAAWCAPSRYALMSGQYPARDFNASKDLKPAEPTITKLLKDAGYTTAHYGKWHMNYSTDYAENPGDFGIDEHFSTNHNGNGKTWTRQERRERYFRAGSTDAYVDMAIDFIDKTKAKKTPKPFYINLWIYPTHSYIDPTPEQLDLYKDLKVDLNDFSKQQQDFLKIVSKYGDIDKSMQAYSADVTAMDNALGRLLDHLKETGLDENTIIVFSSDNGPGPINNLAQQEEKLVERYEQKPLLLNSVGSAKDFRERKGSFRDGGIRVPFIVSWPGHIPQGKVDDTSIIQGVDWLPTIASISGVELPESTFDGINVKSAFFGKGITRKEPVFWSENDASAILKDNWKGVMIKNKFALYDIVKDPSEQVNLKDVHSDIAKIMEDDLKEWHKSLNQ